MENLLRVTSRRVAHTKHNVRCRMSLCQLHGDYGGQAGRKGGEEGGCLGRALAQHGPAWQSVTSHQMWIYFEGRAC